MAFLLKVFSGSERLKEKQKSADIVNETFQSELNDVQTKLEVENYELQMLVEMIYDSSYPESQKFLKQPTKDRLYAHKETISSLLFGLAGQGVSVAPLILTHFQKYGCDAISDTLIKLLELVQPLVASKGMPEFTSDDILDAIDLQWHSSVRSSPAFGSLRGSTAASPLQSPRVSFSMLSPGQSMIPSPQSSPFSMEGMLPGSSPGEVPPYGLMTSPRKTQSFSFSPPSSLSDTGMEAGARANSPRRSLSSHYPASDVGLSQSPGEIRLQPLVENDEETSYAGVGKFRKHDDGISEPLADENDALLRNEAQSSSTSAGADGNDHATEENLKDFSTAGHNTSLAHVLPYNLSSNENKVGEHSKGLFINIPRNSTTFEVKELNGDQSMGGTQIADDNGHRNDDAAAVKKTNETIVGFLPLGGDSSDKPRLDVSHHEQYDKNVRDVNAEVPSGKFAAQEGENEDTTRNTLDSDETPFRDTSSLINHERHIEVPEKDIMASSSSLPTEISNLVEDSETLTDSPDHAKEGEESESVDRIPELSSSVETCEHDVQKEVTPARDSDNECEIIVPASSSLLQGDAKGLEDNIQNDMDKAEENVGKFSLGSSYYEGREEAVEGVEGDGTVDGVEGDGAVDVVKEHGAVESVEGDVAVEGVERDGAEESVKGGNAVDGVKGDGAVEGVERDGAVDSVKGDGAVEGVERDGAVDSVKGDGAVEGVERDGAVDSFKGDGAVESVEGDVAVEGIERDGAVDGVKGDGAMDGVKGDVAVEGIERDGAVGGVKGDVAVEGIERDGAVDGVKGDGAVDGVKGDVAVEGIERDGAEESVKGDGAMEGVERDRAVDSVEGDVAVKAIERHGAVDGVKGDGAADGVQGVGDKDRDSSSILIPASFVEDDNSSDVAALVKDKEESCSSPVRSSEEHLAERSSIQAVRDSVEVQEQELGPHPSGIIVETGTDILSQSSFSDDYEDGISVESISSPDDESPSHDTSSSEKRRISSSSSDYETDDESSLPSAGTQGTDETTPSISVPVIGKDQDPCTLENGDSHLSGSKLSGDSTSEAVLSSKIDESQNSCISSDAVVSADHALESSQVAKSSSPELKDQGVGVIHTDREPFFSAKALSNESSGDKEAKTSDENYSQDVTRSVNHSVEDPGDVEVSPDTDEEVTSPSEQDNNKGVDLSDDQCGRNLSEGSKAKGDDETVPTDHSHKFFENEDIGEGTELSHGVQTSLLVDTLTNKEADEWEMKNKHEQVEKGNNDPLLKAEESANEDPIFHSSERGTELDEKDNHVEVLTGTRGASSGVLLHNLDPQGSFVRILTAPGRSVARSTEVLQSGSDRHSIRDSIICTPASSDHSSRTAHENVPRRRYSFLQTLCFSCCSKPSAL